MLRSYIFKLLHSPFLYAGIIGVFGLCLLSKNGFMEARDVFADMHLLLEAQGYRKAFIVFGAIPFAANFADEWNSKTIINCISRKSAFDYAVSSTNEIPLLSRNNLIHTKAWQTFVYSIGQRFV